VCRVHPALYGACSTAAALAAHPCAGLWLGKPNPDNCARLTTRPALPFLPFALPEIGDEEIAEVVDTLRSGWVTTGPKAGASRRTSAPSWATTALHCIAVNSATAGLHLALEALGIGPGDEVITTTHTFTATAEVVRYLGADVKLVDIDPATLNIDPAAVRSRHHAAHQGHPAGALRRPGRRHAGAAGHRARHGLKVVEDAAHALPTTCGGALVGTLAATPRCSASTPTRPSPPAKAACWSRATRHLAQRARTMRLHGMNRDAFDRFTAKVPSWYYEVVAPGFKYNLTDIAAALGIHQLRKAHAFQQRREPSPRYDAAWPTCRWCCRRARRPATARLAPVRAAPG
jgi:dTDP-4-amino-4,6-dideoxygalactose transaminase